MDAQQFTELASRWVSGDRLAPAEEQGLLDWLDKHPEARHELLEDEGLDSLLRSWPRLEETADDFVGDCLRRASGEAAKHPEPAIVVAAPPIIVPPVVVLRPQNAPGDSRRSRRLLEGGGRWLAAVAGCSAALLLVAIGWRWLAGGPQAGDANRPAKPLAGDQNMRPEPAGAFATLTQCSAATWETPLATGDRLAAGRLNLTAGTAELQFDKGSIVRLCGPAVLELRSGNDLFMKSGSLAAKVPPPAVGFSVATPLSQIVDLGTEFDVVVEDSGLTQTVVRKGRVSFRPQRGQEKLGTPIELAAGALDHAMVSVPAVVGPVLPVTIVARGEGRFLGRLSAGGKTAEFRTRKAFREFRAMALQQLRAAPGEFGRKWPTLADGAGRGIGRIGGIAAPTKSSDERGPAAAPDVSVGSHENLAPGTAAEGQTVEVQEDGKTISITDSKESGITVTITESVGGKKKMTEVRAGREGFGRG